jgi:hypothetical protein
MALSAQFVLKVYQMNVKSAFVNGDLEEVLHATTMQTCGGKKRAHGLHINQINVLI